MKWERCSGGWSPSSAPSPLTLPLDDFWVSHLIPTQPCPSSSLCIKATISISHRQDSGSTMCLVFKLVSQAQHLPSCRTCRGEKTIQCSTHVIRVQFPLQLHVSCAKPGKSYHQRPALVPTSKTGILPHFTDVL